MIALLSDITSSIWVTTILPGAALAIWNIYQGRDKASRKEVEAVVAKLQQELTECGEDRKELRSKIEEQERHSDRQDKEIDAVKLENENLKEHNYQLMHRLLVQHGLIGEQDQHDKQQP